MDTIKVGIIGCGHIAGRHIDCLKALGGNEIIAVADIDESSARKRSAEIETSPTVYTDPFALINNEDLDALYICVPPFAHGEIEKTAIAKKVPLFIEKPVGPNFAVAEKLASFIPDFLPVSIAYNWRYLPNLEKIKALIQDNKALVYNAEWKEQMADAPWWHKREMSGGALVDQASHLLDMAIYLFGPVKQVTSVIMRRDCPQPDGDIPDTILATWEFVNGTIGRLLHTCVLNQLKHRIGFDVIFPGIEARLERVGDLEIIHSRGTEKEAGNFDNLHCNVDSYLSENKIFLEAVKTGDCSQIRCSYHDALQTLAFADAIYECYETGQAVEL